MTQIITEQHNNSTT